MKKLVNFFKVHFLIFDTIVCAGIFYMGNFLLRQLGFRNIICLIYDSSKELFPIFLNSGLTLLGFLLTGISIILIFLQSERLESLKEGGHYKSILNIYFNAIQFTCIFTITSFLGLVSEKGYTLAHITGLALFVVAARLMRCVWIIQQIANIIYKDT
jgi:hypothetical protein